jgi:hypothetical protein
MRQRFSDLMARASHVDGLAVGAALVPGLFLAFACATGSEVSTEDVVPIRIVFDSGMHDAGAMGGRKGSGGAVTAGGTVGAGGFTGNGGTTQAAGGSGGKSSTGMGGTQAMGGTSSGGRASGGTTAMGGMGGGKGGTTSSGGTTASGGTTSSGGTTASGGTTSTGGMTATGGTTSMCPGYTTDDACSKCICMKCASQVMTCYQDTNTTKVSQCKAIQECAQMNHCASTPCYCGSDALCLNPNGPCVTVINQAANNGGPLAVQQQSGDTTTAIGRANAIGMCSTSNCKSECGL